jgi:hypothetical protein
MDADTKYMPSRGNKENKKKYMAEYRRIHSTEADKKKNLDRQADYIRRAGPEGKEKRRLYMIEYRRKNKAEIKRVHLKYLEEHKEEVKAAKKITDHVYYERTKPERLAKNGAYAKKNRPMMNQHNKTYRKRHHARLAPVHRRNARNSHYKKAFGITLKERELLVKLTRVCHCCGRGFSKTVYACIDHNHATGTIRGILCSPCNLALGSLKDDPVIIQNLLDYIKNPPYV